MRVLTDAEWERLCDCTMVAQTIYLFVLREAAMEAGEATVEMTQAEMSWEVERRGDWASRDRLRKARSELEHQGLIVPVKRRPIAVYQLPWVWPAGMTNLINAGGV